MSLMLVHSVVHTHTMAQCSSVPVKVYLTLYNTKYTHLFFHSQSDNNIYLYNTEGYQFTKFKTIPARDVGWSVLDVAFRSVVYYCHYHSPSVLSAVLISTGLCILLGPLVVSTVDFYFRVFEATNFYKL